MFATEPLLVVAHVFFFFSFSSASISNIFLDPI